ncbi:peptidase [Virgibacillus profundi]|uniref:Peptidase n=1 Tax=Virgibacillus profundi TaxID=2024555 RepID=A0A2A2IH58_9BACI|nr:C40 family peptidase [Virgibacillus profundi]PAV31341.1 peptidase [Virgibacillus profundi]PXY55527.1 NlpC/P60 family protein [Virgibacillus profundi]
MVKQTFDQFPEEMWVTAVQVATVWTTPESARDIDAHGTDNPTNIDQWISGLTYETNLALCDENRVQTQLLYGEPVLVTEIKEKWAHIVIPSQPSKKDMRGYPGWVPLSQLSKVNRAKWKSPETAAIINDKTWLESDHGEKEMKLSYMTFLPVAEVHEDRVEVKTPHGNKFLPKASTYIFSSEKGMDPASGENIVKAADPFVSLDYFWGGMSSFGYDCSGLAYAMHKANGYEIARDADDQAASGENVDDDKLLPGDLVFFAYEEGKGRLHHVGIYYGDGKMIHAPQTGKGIEIISMKGTKYEKELCAARRYWCRYRKGNNDDGR